MIHNEIFNVGSNAQNYQIRGIAEIIAEVFPGCSLSVGDSTGDARNYQVDFTKINERLPGFACRFDVRSGAEQLLQVFRAIDMTGELFESRGHTRIEQIKYLLSTGQIDRHLFWVDRSAWAAVPAAPTTAEPAVLPV